MNFTAFGQNIVTTQNPEIENYNLSLYNSLGQLLNKKEAINNSFRFNINSLASEVYILKLDGGTINKTYKFIKN